MTNNSSLDGRILVGVTNTDDGEVSGDTKFHFEQDDERIYAHYRRVINRLALFQSQRQHSRESGFGHVPFSKNSPVSDSGTRQVVRRLKEPLSEDANVAGPGGGAH
ncbi:MAG: hypothetical protein V5A39_02505 [Haloarculaceae archaeon]